MLISNAGLLYSVPHYQEKSLNRLPVFKKADEKPTKREPPITKGEYAIDEEPSHPKWMKK